MDLTIAEALLARHGARNIRRHGWIQGEYHNADGYCLLGSIGAAFMIISESGAALADRLVRLSGAPVEENANTNPTRLARWNDAKGRTVDEVLNVLEKAAEEAEAEGR